MLGLPYVTPSDTAIDHARWQAAIGCVDPDHMAGKAVVIAGL